MDAALNRVSRVWAGREKSLGSLLCGDTFFNLLEIVETETEAHPASC